MEKFKLLFKEKKFLVLAVILLLGIMFLLSGEYTSHRTADQETTEGITEAKMLEARLAEILEQMEGVESAHVLVMLRESVEAGSSPLYGSEERSKPAVCGVSVVCKGAKNVHVKRKIILLLASTLNLNENQIYVSE
ncbi:MAG: hypothetical protein IJC84_05045 [Clostridia bacterium]|nr:hypothetical protein [Clostridia bacterium]